MNAVSPGERLIRLRRDGRKPLRFFGSRIARHDGRWPEAPCWYELGLYSTTNDLNLSNAAPGVGYAVEIVARACSGPARCHAHPAATLDHALTLLETHDPGQDSCPGLTVAWAASDPQVQPAALAADLARLHQDLYALQRSYRIAVGTFLAQLGARD